MLELLRTWKHRAEAVIAAHQAHKRVVALEQHAPHIDGPAITAGLRALGFVAGDTVLMHSSLKSLGFVDGGPRAVLEAVFAAISPGGTLVVPTYYMPGGTIYSTCHTAGYVFDRDQHGTGLGALPTTFLTMPGVVRGIHPTHSLSALGPQAVYVVGDHHRAPSTFGPHSPWDRCLKLDAKVLGLGVSLHPVAYYHALEDAMGDGFPLPVRMRECFPVKCRAADGSIIEVPITPLDPAYMQRRIDHPSREDLRRYFREDFRRAGILREVTVGTADVWCTTARDFYARIERLAKAGLTIYAPPEALTAFID